MTGGGGGVGEDIKGGELRKFLDTRKGGTEKNVGLGRGGGGGGGPPKICILQNQPMTSSYTRQFNDLCNSAISHGLQM